MKKLLYVFLAMTVAFAVGFAMVSCGGDDDAPPQPPAVIPPTITGVTITSWPVVIANNETPTYVATVAGTNGSAAAFDPNITWSVEAKVSSTNIGTTAIAADPDDNGKGILTVANTVSGGVVLVVKAAATGDPTKFDTKEVAVYSTSEKPVATSVAVDPATVSVDRGQNQTFTALVAGTNITGTDWETAVTWTVAGGGASPVALSPTTSITHNGVLTVAGGEDNNTLTVTATALVPGTSNAVISGTATVTVTGEKKLNLIAIRFWDYQGGEVIKTIQIEPEVTIDNAGKTLAKVPNRGTDFRFNKWVDQYNADVTVDSSWFSDVNVYGTWYDGVFRGSTAGVLEKVYVEDTALPLYQFDLSALVGTGKSYATVLALMEDIKGIEASYGVSEAAISAGAPALRAFGPYFFNGTTAVELEAAAANNPPGTKFWGDFKADLNSKLVARLDGGASLPATFNKFQAYLLDATGDGWGGDAPSANSWFTRTVTFNHTDVGGAVNSGFSWGKTLRFLVGENHDGTFFVNGKVPSVNGTDPAVQVVDANTDFTKVFFGIGLMRRNAGAVVNTTSSPWDHGRLYLVKDVKLLVGKDAATPTVVNGTVPSLSVPAHDYIQGTTSATGTISLDAISNQKQVFVSYINPVVGSWRGGVNEAFDQTTSNAPGWIPPAGGLPEAPTHLVKNLAASDITLYYGGDSGEQSANNNGQLAIDPATGIISVNLTQKAADAGPFNAGITFEIPTEWKDSLEIYTYDSITVWYDAVIDAVSGTNAQFATKSGFGKMSPNLSAIIGGNNAWPSVSNGTGQRIGFAASLVTIGAPLGESDTKYGISFQLNNYADENVPQKYTIKFLRVSLRAP